MYWSLRLIFQFIKLAYYQQSWQFCCTLWQVRGGDSVGGGVDGVGVGGGVDGGDDGIDVGGCVDGGDVGSGVDGGDVDVDGGNDGGFRRLLTAD